MLPVARKGKYQRQFNKDTYPQNRADGNQDFGLKQIGQDHFYKTGQQAKRNMSVKHECGVKIEEFLDPNARNAVNRRNVSSSHNKREVSKFILQDERNELQSTLKSKRGITRAGDNVQNPYNAHNTQTTHKTFDALNVNNKDTDNTFNANNKETQKAFYVNSRELIENTYNTLPPIAKPNYISLAQSNKKQINPINYQSNQLFFVNYGTNRDNKQDYQTTKLQLKQIKKLQQQLFMQKNKFKDLQNIYKAQIQILVQEIDILQKHKPFDQQRLIQQYTAQNISLKETNALIKIQNTQLKQENQELKRKQKEKNYEELKKENNNFYPNNANEKQQNKQTKILKKELKQMHQQNNQYIQQLKIVGDDHQRLMHEAERLLLQKRDLLHQLQQKDSIIDAFTQKKQLNLSKQFQSVTQFQLLTIKKEYKQKLEAQILKIKKQYQIKVEVQTQKIQIQFKYQINNVKSKSQEQIFQIKKEAENQIIKIKKQFQKKIIDLQQQLQKFKKNNNHKIQQKEIYLQKQLQIKEKQIKELKIDFNRKEERQIENYSQFMRMHKILQQQCESQKTKLDTYEQKLYLKDKQIEMCQKQILKQKTFYDNAQKNICQQIKSYQKCSQDYQELQQKYSKVIKQFENIQKQYEQRCVKYEKTILQQQYMQKQNNKQYKETKNQLERKIQENKQQYYHIDKVFLSLKQSHFALQNIHEALSQNYRELKQDYAILQKNNYNLNTDLSVAKDSIKKTELNLNYCQKEIIQLKLIISSLHQKKLFLQNQYNESISKKRQNQQNIAKRSSDVRDEIKINHIINQYQIVIQSLKLNLNNISEHQNKLAIEKKHLQSVVESNHLKHKQQLSALKKEIERSNDENIRLHKKINQKTAIITAKQTSLDAQLKQKHLEFNKIKNEYQKVKKQLQLISQQNVVLKDKLQKKCIQVDKAIKQEKINLNQIKTIKEKNHEMQNKITQLKKQFQNNESEEILKKKSFNNAIILYKESIQTLTKRLEQKEHYCLQINERILAKEKEYEILINNLNTLQHQMKLMQNAHQKLTNEYVRCKQNNDKLKEESFQIKNEIQKLRRQYQQQKIFIKQDYDVVYAKYQKYKGIAQKQMTEINKLKQKLKQTSIEQKELKEQN